MFTKSQSAVSSFLQQVTQTNAQFFAHSQKLAEIVKPLADLKEVNPFKVNEAVLAHAKESFSLLGTSLEQTVEHQYKVVHAFLDDVAAQKNEVLAPVVANAKTLVTTTESAVKTLKSKLSGKK